MCNHCNKNCINDKDLSIVIHYYYFFYILLERNGYSMIAFLQAILYFMNFICILLGNIFKKCFVFVIF